MGSTDAIVIKRLMRQIVDLMQENIILKKALERHNGKDKKLSKSTTRGREKKIFGKTKAKKSVSRKIKR